MKRLFDHFPYSAAPWCSSPTYPHYCSYKFSIVSSTPTTSFQGKLSFILAHSLSSNPYNIAFLNFQKFHYHFLFYCRHCLVNHKKKNKEDREIYLVVNGPGFNPGQIEELKDQLKRSKVDGIYIVDLHKYDWSEIDREWRLDGKSISIQKYYENMYNMANKERIYFAIEIDTFRLVALALLEQFTKQKGGIYIDFDSLSAIDGHIGKNITIPKGILLGYVNTALSNDDKIIDTSLNNDLIAINNPKIIDDILSQYKSKMLSQNEICNRVKERCSSNEDLSSILESLLSLIKGMVQQYIPPYRKELFKTGALGGLIYKILLNEHELDIGDIVSDNVASVLSDKDVKNLSLVCKTINSKANQHVRTCSQKIKTLLTQLEEIVSLEHVVIELF